ncbi:helix-turn-helix domain-containing protein [Butyrivibrio fibrisolvens]|uniref:helix-turn-helix domain-containing protein n=1 Tax=Butyrivibrio fibrisolvens TaxID=831 RepID=UPI0003FDDD47|nr:helix-turn-helix transcriptional regulator [Butyrivibrio fibrisolvens]
MDERYEKIMEIIEMNRFRQRLGLLDYIACWEEPDRVKGLDLEATKKRVCDLIKAKGLKDKTIADKLGITPQAVNKWRHKGSFFVIENLYVLSGLLGVSVDKLLVPVAVKKWEVLIEKR